MRLRIWDPSIPPSAALARSASASKAEAAGVVGGPARSVYDPRNASRAALATPAAIQREPGQVTRPGASRRSPMSPGSQRYEKYRSEPAGAARAASRYGFAGPAKRTTVDVASVVRSFALSAGPAFARVGVTDRLTRSATSAARSGMADGDSSLTTMLPVRTVRAAASSSAATASCAGVGASAKPKPPPGSTIGSVNSTGTWASSTARANVSSYTTEAPTTIASARSSAAARRSSMSVGEGLPATSTILRRARGLADACWSAHSSIASRCGPPFGEREPERSSKAVTLYVPGSRVGTGVGVSAGLGCVQAASSRASASVSARTRALGARAVGKRRVRRVHVGRGVLGPGVRLALRLRDRLLDLVRELRADRLEVLLGNPGGEQVREGTLHGIPRAPLLDLLLRPVAAVVVVRGVRLIAIALQLDEARPLAGAGVVGRELRLLVAVEQVHPVGDEPRHRVRSSLLGDVLHRGLLLDARGDREEVVLDDEDHRELVHRGEVGGLVEVPRARGGAAIEREDDEGLLAQLQPER